MLDINSYEITRNGILVKLVAEQPDIVIPKEVVEIADNLEIENIKLIRTISFGANIEKLGRKCFANISNLEVVNFEFDNKSLDIENDAFRNCEVLNSVNLPQNTNSIGGNCFSGCVALKKLVMPITIKKVGYWAFERCGGEEGIRLLYNGTEYNFNQIDGAKMLNDF